MERAGGGRGREDDGRPQQSVITQFNSPSHSLFLFLFSTSSGDKRSSGEWKLLYYPPNVFQEFSRGDKDPQTFVSRAPAAKSCLRVCEKRVALTH